MNHAIEQFKDGTAAFYSHREPAWHRLGTVTSRALSLDEALETAQLDWNVFKTDGPISAPFSNGDDFGIVTLDTKFLTYRKHKKLGYDALGVVGEDYTIVQNRTLGELVQMLVDESGGIWETMGSLWGGRQVFMSIKLPTTMSFDEKDPHEWYLVVASSHDGSMAVTAVITNVRVVCQNTWNMALGSARAKYVFRHTSGATIKVQEVRDALRLTFKYQEAFERTMERLMTIPMDSEQFDAFVRQVLPDLPEKAVTVRKQSNLERSRDALRALWGAPTQDFGRGTKYGALMSVTEFDQWVKPTFRKGADLTKAANIILGKESELVSRAYALLV